MRTVLAHPLTLPALFALSASGCVVYGYPCKDGLQGGSGGGDETFVDGDTGGGSLLDDDTGEGEDTGGDLLDDPEEGGGDLSELPDDTELDPDDFPQPPVFSLDPAVLEQGQAVVATLVADDVNWDHTAITHVSLGEGLVLCSLEVTEAGVSLAYGAWGDASLGVVPVDVDLGEDGVIPVEGGAEVVAPGGVVMPDPDVDPCTTLD